MRTRVAMGFAVSPQMLVKLNAYKVKTGIARSRVVNDLLEEFFEGL